MILPQGSINAQNAYFCQDQGTKLFYQRKDVTSGEVKYNHVMTIDKTTKQLDNYISVKYSSSFTKPNGGAMYGGPIQLSATISPDGDVKMDIAQSVASVFRNILGTSKIKTTGGTTTLPHQMQPSDRLPNASATVSASIVKMNIDVTERKVLRTETIKTPAGEFDCIVVSEHKVEKGTMRNRITTALTWYCKGIGMVRHDTYDKNLKLETSEQLIQISK